jgi:hypothetical protein
LDACTTPLKPGPRPGSIPEWKSQERKSYTSEASWQREQEIIDEAGGGELVFAETLITHWNKIVITDPAWRPDPRWRVEAGFDHGKTNPTALERVYTDYEGTIYMCGEYYMPGFEIWQHAPVIKTMEDIRKVAAGYADPTIFPQIFQQSQGMYADQGKPRSAPSPSTNSTLSRASNCSRRLPVIALTSASPRA